MHALAATGPLPSGSPGEVAAARDIVFSLKETTTPYLPSARATE
jgi:hypothetical protein